MRTLVRNSIIAIIWQAKILVARAKHMLSSLIRPCIGSVEHVTIPVRDLPTAKRFYCDVLGATHFMTVDDAVLQKFGRLPAARGGQGSHHISVYLGGATRVDLFLQETGQPVSHNGHPHFAFKVSPFKLSKWKQILEGKGIPTDGPIRLGPPGQASLYFNDPFGNHLEITCFGYPVELQIRPPEMSSLEWGAGISA